MNKLHQSNAWLIDVLLTPSFQQANFNFTSREINLLECFSMLTPQSYSGSS